MLIGCPECHREISDSAATCPHCGYSLTESDKTKAKEQADVAQIRAKREARVKAEKEAADKSNQKIGSWITLGAAIIVLVFLWRACSSGGDSKKAKMDRCADPVEAKITSQTFVERQLKSPATADWCNTASDFTADLSNGVWTVTGCVDSQNSFGATVRTNFTVKMTCDAENWNLVDLTTQ